MERTDSLLGGPLGLADIQMWHKPLTAVLNIFALETDHQNATACSITDEYLITLRIICINSQCQLVSSVIRSLHMGRQSLK